MKKLALDTTFIKELPADEIIENYSRQVANACYSFVTPKTPSKPELIHTSSEVAQLIGLNNDDVSSELFLAYFSGARIMDGTQPYAACYGGHQFGSWAGQLGDGRAINLAEIVHKNKRWTLQLKGAGKTPYSRSADGLAVLRSSIREHFCSEAMFHLGVSTTRSLSLILTGDQVLRDMLYDGNPAYEKGAVVCRIAPTFIRFGNFEILTARKNYKNLKALTDYTIKYFYPDIEQGTKKGYLQFFESIANKTREMIINWQRVGFVHGVMNTDNMSILGLTIDYGPYGWLEGYDDNWSPNTTDAQYKRYGFGNQLNISLWNLMQLANALYPLIEDVTALEEILMDYKTKLQAEYLTMMRTKIGLNLVVEDDKILIKELENTLQLSETDMTIFFRLLSKINKNNTAEKALSIVNEAFYIPTEIQNKIKDAWINWFTKYITRLNLETSSNEEKVKQMNLVNPKYVLRNYMAQLAIDDANKGEYKLIEELYQLLKQPYAEQTESEKWFTKRPEWARQKIGCSMLSCSS